MQCQLDGFSFVFDVDDNVPYVWVGTTGKSSIALKLLGTNADSFFQSKDGSKMWSLFRGTTRNGGLVKSVLASCIREEEIAHTLLKNVENDTSQQALLLQNLILLQYVLASEQFQTLSQILLK